MSVQPKQWQVFHLFCHCALPSPKYKYVVLACLKPLFGFMINSRINPFITEHPKLLVCEVPIKKLEHSFLKQDSFIDCREICPLTLEELNQPVGELNIQVIQQIIKAVPNCPTLSQRYKKLIIYSL